ncbi:MAG: class I SAM-dependent methyltransferase, partial [Chloroflexota bacterium]
FAKDFSETRQRLQPGVTRIIETLPPTAKVLDLGSGNGELAEEIGRRGYTGTYLGLDFSDAFVTISNARKLDFAQFKQSDLTNEAWAENLAPASCDTIYCFAVMHHIPSEVLRNQFLARIHGLLKPEGLFVHSHWQFLTNQRLRARIQPWDKVELADKDLDEGDYLMDWRRGGQGLRYVHHYSQSELAVLAQQNDFIISEEFYSDGESQNLGLYQVWKLAL